MVRCLSIGALAAVACGLSACIPQTEGVDARPDVWAGKDQCVGAGDTATLTAIAQGTGPLTYRWSSQSRPQGAAEVELSNETSAATTTSELTVQGTYSFRVIVTDAQQLARSSYVAVTVGPAGASGDFCVSATGPGTLNLGGSATYAATPDYTGTFAYLWEAFTAGDDPQDEEPTDDVTFDDPSLAETTATAAAPGSFVLRVRVTDEDTGDVGSGAVRVVVPDTDELTVSITGPTTAATDQTIELTAVPENATAALTYAWEILSGTADLENDDQATVQVTPTVAGAVQIQVSVTEDGTERTASATHSVTVEEPDQVAVEASAAGPLLRLGDEMAITASVPGEFDSVVYSWVVDRGPGEIADTTSPTTTLTATAGDTIEFHVDVMAQRGEQTLWGTSDFLYAVSYEADPDEQPIVVIDVEDFGEIHLAMEVEAAPKTVANFLRYVDEDFYDGVVFHRVVAVPDDFVVQGGAFEPDGDILAEKEGARDPVESEAPNGLSNIRTTVAMALRGQDANSGDTQFFINLSDDNDFLDEGPPPFTVFARVAEGMDVVDQIADVEVGSRPVRMEDGSEREMDDVPLEDVIMREVYRLQPGDGGSPLTGSAGS